MKTCTLAVLALLCTALLGCNTLDAAIDCHAICTRYQTCFDAQYDTAACEQRCQSHSGSDAEYRHAANTCSACIDDQACTSAVFRCGARCSTVVP